MHELSLLEDVLQILEQNAESQGYRRVKRIWLEIGQLSCVEPEALRFAFDAVMKDTLADRAVLEIVEQPGQGECAGCHRTVPVESLYAACPRCGHFDVRITEGMAMRVKQLEVE